MDSNKYRAAKAVDTSFLASCRKTGEAKKKMGRPTKESQIQKALKEGNKHFFKRILDDESEAKLWKIFVTGKQEQLNDLGEVVRDAEGRPFYMDAELNPVCWAAFKQMVAYKRGVPNPADKSSSDKEPIHVHFNIMGASESRMTDHIKTLEQLPQAT